MKLLGKGIVAAGTLAIAALAGGCAHAYRLPQCTATPVAQPAAQPMPLKGHNSCKGHAAPATASTTTTTTTGTAH